MGQGCSTTTTVQSGDLCGTLAQRCGISTSDFLNDNPNINCNALQINQKVCCSPGGLPVPQQNKDGSCYVYTAQSGDNCNLIALNNGLTVDQIESFNSATWGWNGCPRLQAGFNMCLSTGTPPFPAANPGAVCGPTVSGTANPGGSSASWATLNSCPLNACCSAQGQCGTTPDWCTATSSGTGAPGSWATGTNGCISNCGTAITNNANAPSQFRKIAYFENWALNRPCLNMDLSQLDVGNYTHVHYAFATLNSDFTISVPSGDKIFSQLVGLSGVKRIVSIGGAATSPDSSVNTIFRSAVSSANAQTFANNILSFLNQYNLDGIDIDWEYPVGTDGFWFTIFLSTLRQTLGSSKVISIAASASYGNLKGMPIQTMSNYVDYIVFMTYDLHGQWDYGSDVDPGCSTPGACLRSHVNWTETSYALGMITKSGVNANQVVVGVTSYGRSFQMAQAGCTGPQCLYTGPSSGALAGRCTQTQGYLADAEIYEILATNPSASTQIDDNISQSDVLVYNQTQWAAYMSKTTKAARTNRYHGLNFGGVANWAVDLEDFHTTPSATAQVSGGRFNNATARAL